MESVTILVCEDEKLIAKDLEHSLNRLGYNVVGVAKNAEEALSIAREKKPNLAIMDININGPISGIEVALILKAELGMPAIFVTAYSDVTTVEKAKITEPLSYLLKPFSEEALLAAIETGMALHRKIKGIPKP